MMRRGTIVDLNPAREVAEGFPFHYDNPEDMDFIFACGVVSVGGQLLQMSVGGYQMKQYGSMIDG